MIRHCLYCLPKKKTHRYNETRIIYRQPEELLIMFTGIKSGNISIKNNFFFLSPLSRHVLKYLTNSAANSPNRKYAS